MPQVRKSLLFSLGVVFVAAAVLLGCNGTDVDDPENSDSLLVVQSVDPAAVVADVSPEVNLDPNTPASPPPDDVVSVKVENVLRNQGASGVFNDILITSFDLACANNSLQLSGSTTGIPVSLTVQAQSTTDIDVVVASGGYKLTNAGTLTDTSDTCSIVFNGQDLGGEPIISTPAIFVITFLDVP